MRTAVAHLPGLRYDLQSLCQDFGSANLNTEAGQAVATKTEQRLRTSGTNCFFVCMASVLLLIVAVGFAKSFYLRNFIHRSHAVSALPAYIILHGVVLTLWFLAFLGQTLLVALGKSRFHRSLGVVSAFLAAIIFALSMLVVIRSVVRESSLVVIGDMVILLLFAVVVTGGIWFRRQPDTHKRLMLVGSIYIVAPAIARWPGAQSMLPISVVVPQLLLLTAMTVYDLFLQRRMHRATVWGVVLYFVASGITISVATSKLGHALIESLK
jgi:hypothetical protein